MVHRVISLAIAAVRANEACVDNVREPSTSRGLQSLAYCSSPASNPDLGSGLRRVGDLRWPKGADDGLASRIGIAELGVAT